MGVSMDSWPPAKILSPAVPTCRQLLTLVSTIVINVLLCFMASLRTVNTPAAPARTLSRRSSTTQQTQHSQQTVPVRSPQQQKILLPPTSPSRVVIPVSQSPQSPLQMVSPASQNDQSLLWLADPEPQNTQSPRHVVIPAPHLSLIHI